MNIKHLQLNTSLLKSPEKVMEFIVANNVDIACLQEICYPIGSESPLKSLCEKAGYEYIEQPHYFYLPTNQFVGVAIISRFPITDYVTNYYNGD